MKLTAGAAGALVPLPSHGRNTEPLLALAPSRAQEQSTLASQTAAGR